MLLGRGGRRPRAAPHPYGLDRSGDTAGASALLRCFAMPTRESSRPTRYLLGCFLVLGLASCGDKNEGSASKECTADPTLLSETRACTVDDNCPCGSSCAFGLCSAECSADSDCESGERCDQFGRCRGEDDTSAVRELRAEDGLAIRTSTDVVRFESAASEEVFVGLAHDGSDAVELRIEGRDVVDVSCDDGANYSDSCTLVANADEDTVVAARPRAGSADGAGMLVIHPMRGSASFVHVQTGDAVLGLSARSFFSAGEPALAASGPLASGAIFRGKAVFETVGADGVGEIPVEGLPSLPLEVDLFPSGSGSQVLTIREPAAALHPDGGFYGSLQEDSIAIPAWRHIAAEDLSVPQSEVVVQPQVTNLVATPELLTFDLEIAYAGFSAARPYYRLHVDLQRVGDAPAGLAPNPGQSYVSPFATSRAAAPTAWEARANEVCSGSACNALQISRFLCNENFSQDEDFTGDNLATSGDAMCSGGRAFAPDYLLAIDGLNSLSRFGLVDSCRAELLALDEEPTGGNADLDARDCLHPLRWYGVIAATIGEVRGNASPNSVEARTALRNAQQLLETSGYVALEAVQGTRYNSGLGGDCGAATCPSLASLEEYVQASQKVVEPFLHPRYGQYLDALASTQTEVDYASAFGSEAYSGPTISYSMLRASVAQLELLDRAAEGDHFAGRAAPPDGYATIALRKALLLRAYAAALAVRNDGGAGLSGAEATDFSAQGDIFAEVFGRVSGRIIAMRRGDNPLAIEDSSVPLYLDRDVESPEARAFALTNYLLDPSASNWIGQAISDATTAQGAARTAWQARIQAELTGLQIENDTELYRTGVARDYGRRIAALCPVADPTSGTPVVETEILDGIASGALEVDPFSCFINSSNAECAAFAEPSAYTESEAHKDICMAAMMREQTRLAGFDDPALGLLNPQNAALDRLRDFLKSNGNFSIARGGEGFQATFGAEVLDVSEEQMRSLGFGLDNSPASAGTDFGGFDPRGSASSTVEDYGAFVDLIDAQRFCETEASQTFGATPQVESSAPKALDSADCYRGGLGEAALATRAAFTEVEASRARLDEHYERYRIAVNTCTLNEQADNLLEAETRAFEEEVEDLQAASGWLRVATSVFGGATGLSSGYANRKNDRDDGQKLAGKASVGLGLLTAGFAIATKVVDDKIKEKEAKHEEYMDKIKDELALHLCMNEASKEMVGLRTASLEIVQATQEMGAALLRFQNLQGELESLKVSGLAAMADSVGPRTFAGALWLDESLRDFETKMRLARRVTYLAALAVDYERQESNADGFRNRILAATTPAELGAVRQDMLASTANRQIGSGTVGDAFAVVSLRDDIMALADHAEAGEGFSALSPIDRFRIQLTDPHYAVYEDGAYLGQRIPFELVPPGAAANGPASDFFSANQCAERLWSVNAGIVGDDGVSGAATFTRVEMLKHNTFFSQWCRPESRPEEEYQFSGIRPSENLFLDPFADGSFLDVPRTDPSSYSRAVLSNVRTDIERADVERQEYAQGAQSGFAGRALFGQYSVFFPADSLSYRCSDGESCGSQSGNALDLSLVEDVLIRFDYVAGAKP